MTYKFLDLDGLKHFLQQFVSKLKAVAFSGNYNDLSGKPSSLPANGGNSDTVDGKHATDLQNYNNLSNKPTIVNNGTTTAANTILDGRMGKILADKDANLQSQITSLNSALGGLEFIDTATTGNSGGTALSMQNQLKGENLYIIFIRHLNGADDCYEPYALLLFMRSQNYQYTTLGNSRDLKNTQINEGRLTINFNSAQWARMWVYKIS